MYKVHLETLDRRFIIYADVEIGKWAKISLDLDEAVFAENSSISIYDLRFKTKEDLNLFKIIFADKYYIRESFYENSQKKEEIASTTSQT